jgi:hypothetical protein
VREEALLEGFLGAIDLALLAEPAEVGGVQLSHYAATRTASSVSLWQLQKASQR